MPMLPSTYNKPTSLPGSSFIGTITAPGRDVACSSMTAEYLNSLFVADGEAGTLTWKNRPVDHFPNEATWKMWHSRFAGKRTGSKVYSEAGRPAALVVGINHKLYGAHRIMWQMLVGPIPDGMQIDHINCNPFDNRLCNLRLSSCSENCRNRRISSTNSSGYKGVSYRKGVRRWAAGIKVHGKRMHLGVFDTPEEAHSAYCEASKKYHGDFARTK